MSSMPPDCTPDHPDCEHSHGILGGGDRSRELRGAGKRSLALALVLIVGYMFVEVVGGLLSGSLALIADAGHMLTDAASIGLALAAMHFATRAASPTCWGRLPSWCRACSSGPSDGTSPIRS